ncbi:MAG: undecaprenyl-diphosphate phosphatase [Bacteroidetes bacterium]|nr:undecaprenyl-diphosphate phosphatase [Bacteroidota bacterium]
MTYLEAIILAVIEGLTEFLPVSSTGHMIIASTFMGIANDEFTKLFTVAIQFGAILSVVVLYFKKFLQGVSFYVKLGVAFIPTGILGLLLKDTVDGLLENVTVVAVSLLLGGIILLFIDKWFAKNETEGSDEVSLKTGLIIGTIQSIAMIPGVSRSAATIVGGLTQKLTRKAAAEFSFFLAVPTMFAATVKSMWDSKELLMASENNMLLILITGNVVAFVVAYLAIKSFIGFLTKHGFKVFGYYRIVVGLVLLLLILSGYQLEMI